MGSHQAHGLQQGSLGRFGDKSHEQHAVGQVLDPEPDDEEAHVGIGIFLGMHVRDCDSKGG